MSTQNTMTAAQPATLADFIESEDGSNFLASADCGLADTYCADIADHLSDRLSSAIEDGDADPVGMALSFVEDIADNLQGAANDIRNFISRYFEQSGAIERAELAIMAFCEAPTAANRAALIEATRVMEGHHVPMQAKLARTVRSFIRYGRMPASRINFGNLYHFARNHIREELMTREAA